MEGKTETLTTRFETKLKVVNQENRELRLDLERMRKLVQAKDLEAKEAKELMGIYSAKLTKLKRQYKKLRDDDEESYMEMTF